MRIVALPCEGACSLVPRTHVRLQTPETTRYCRKACKSAQARIGDAVVNWLGLSWISTVILGVPVLTAALGKQHAQLGVIAGISSFIFQLPVRMQGLVH